MNCTPKVRQKTFGVQFILTQPLDPFDEFLESIEEKYEFQTKDCLYMTCQSYSERS